MKKITQGSKKGAEMERLTERIYDVPDGESGVWVKNHELINLPCTVGDIVYVPTRDFISELRIAHIIISKNNIFFHWMLNTGIYPNLDGFSIDKIGETVFLTESEAEMKLKELKCSISGRCKGNKDIEDIER